MRAGWAGAARWALVLAAGVVIGLGCSRRRSYCQHYAEAVSECCPDHEYGHLRVLCEHDMASAQSGGPGCVAATFDLYECGEEHACDDECRETNVDPCAQELNALINVCSQPPLPP